jgi:hypothetical protein
MPRAGFTSANGDLHEGHTATRLGILQAKALTAA